MEQTDRVAERWLVRCVLGLMGALPLLAGPRPASAQAWVPPAGVVIVSVVYQDINNTNHRLTDGSLFDGYDSRSRGALLSVDYAITDRLSFSVGLPYLGAKYTGPEPSLFGLPLDECFCWNHGWQDLGFTARYNITNEAFALTPSVSAGVPSHDYEYFGEAVLGRNLNEVRIALDAGHRLDAISSRLSVYGRYSYAFVEKVLDIGNNRSNMAAGSDVLITRRLLGRIGFSWQRSHGGLRSTEFTEDIQFAQYDRLIRDNHFHMSGGVTVSLPRVDVFASYVSYVSGTDTHEGYAINAGVSWPFER
jgi:hypothetical protein